MPTRLAVAPFPLRLCACSGTVAWPFSRSLRKTAVLAFTARALRLSYERAFANATDICGSQNLDGYSGRRRASALGNNILVAGRAARPLSVLLLGDKDGFPAFVDRTIITEQPPTGWLPFCPAAHSPATCAWAASLRCNIQLVVLVELPRQFLSVLVWSASSLTPLNCVLGRSLPAAHCRERTFSHHPPPHTAAPHFSPNASMHMTWGLPHPDQVRP